MRLKFDAPHQATDPAAKPAYIELCPGNNFEAAVSDLEGFDRIWLIWWFDRNTTWHPKVLPPRGPRQKRGVFATRSPHRPNPIGLTAVELRGVRGRRIEIGPCDLLDGTPIFDIKPYVPSADAFPEARAGWLSQVEEELIETARFKVEVSDLASAQLAWLSKLHAISFFDRARRILAADPSPHRTRRICKLPGGSFRMGCGAWRLYFNKDQERILITHVACGYPTRAILGAEGKIPDQEAQREFLSLWPA